jgi:hypothetical protein
VARAKKHARPDLVIKITNSWELDSTKLQRMGFRRKGTVDNTQIWVNPSGQEVWLLPPAKAVEPGPVVPPTKQIHPDIQRFSCTSRTTRTSRMTSTADQRNCGVKKMSCPATNTPACASSG